VFPTSITHLFLQVAVRKTLPIASNTQLDHNLRLRQPKQLRRAGKYKNSPARFMVRPVRPLDRAVLTTRKYATSPACGQTRPDRLTPDDSRDVRQSETRRRRYRPVCHRPGRGQRPGFSSASFLQSSSVSASAFADLDPPSWMTLHLQISLGL
jgi:hypothetical protein